MDDSVNELISFLAWPLSETAYGFYYVSASWVPYQLRTTSYIQVSSLCGGNVLFHPAEEKIGGELSRVWRDEPRRDST